MMGWSESLLRVKRAQEFPAPQNQGPDLRTGVTGQSVKTSLLSVYRS